MAELKSLYYPFSRCVNPVSLKQLLLVFDQVSFVDPVADDQWRTKLFKDLEVHDGNFSQYRGISSALPDLLDHGCIKRIDPAGFVASERMLRAHRLFVTCRTVNGWTWPLDHKSFVCQRYRSMEGLRGRLFS